MLACAPIVFTYPLLPLHHGLLISRYKRFLADVDFKDNSEEPMKSPTVVYCPNTGSMLSLIPPENISPRCYLSSASPHSKRKYKHTLEIVYQRSAWVGIHSALANQIVENALNLGLISECLHFSGLKREVSVGDSKIDFMVTWGDAYVGDGNKRSKRKFSSDAVVSKMLIEVKSVTLSVPIGPKDGSTDVEEKYAAVFPDCVSERAQKHVSCLASFVRAGLGRAAVIFIIQRDDCSCFSPSVLDPAYASLLHQAHLAGVEVLPYACRVLPEEGVIRLLGKIPFLDPLA